jgi:uncharacterized membrane protein YfcA
MLLHVLHQPQLFLVNIWIKHPNSQTRPIIYYDVCLIFFPLQLGGANIGVVLSYIFPKTVLLICAICVLLFSLTVSGEKAYNFLSREQTLLSKLGDASPAQARDETTYLLARNSSDRAEQGQPTNRDAAVEDDPDCTEIKAARNGDITEASATEPDMKVPWDYIIVFTAVWLLYAVVYVGMEFVTTCTWEYYLLLVIIYPFIFMQVQWSLTQLIESQKAVSHLTTGDRSNSPLRTEDIDAYNVDVDESMATSHLRAGSTDTNEPMAVSAAPVTDIAAKLYSMDVLDGDILWDQLSVVPMILCVLIGCMSVMLGIGGGEMMGPVLLSLNVKPEIIAATIPMMMILSTSSSLVHYMTIGGVPYGYGAWMSVLGFLGGLTGRTLSLWFVQKTNRPSILLLAFCIILSVSLAIYFYYMYLDLDDLDFSFSAFC